MAAHQAFPAVEVEREGSTLYIAFLREAPPAQTAETLRSLCSDTDELHLCRRELYWLCRGRLSDSPLATRRAIIDIVRKICDEQAEELGRLEFEETKIGRLDHKIEKLKIIKLVPGVEFLRSDAVSGDHGLTVTEYAPFGVIGAITASQSGSGSKAAPKVCGKEPRCMTESAWKLLAGSAPLE